MAHSHFESNICLSLAKTLVSDMVSPDVEEGSDTVQQTFFTLKFVLGKNYLRI